jgi:hypothetical protein
MVRAVFDTRVPVSAFLTRRQPGGVSNELLRFVPEGKVELHISADIITRGRGDPRTQPPGPVQLQHTSQMAEASCADLRSRQHHRKPAADARRGAARPRRPAARTSAGSLPALPHPLVQIARGKNAFSVLPIQPFIVGDISEVTKLHRRPCPLDPLGKVPDGRAVAEHGIDPFVLEPVWQLSKHGKDVSEPLGQGAVNVVFDGSGVAQTQHVDIVARLPDPLHSTLALH